MKEKRIMPLKYRIFSIVAFVIILFLAIENHEICAQPVEPIPKAQKEAAKPLDKRAETLPPTQHGKGMASVQPYTSIAEKNIFSPDRKDFPIQGGASKPIVRPQVVLYGVTIAGDYQAASASDPVRPSCSSLSPSSIHFASFLRLLVTHPPEKNLKTHLSNPLKE